MDMRCLAMARISRSVIRMVGVIVDARYEWQMEVALEFGRCGKKAWVNVTGW